jgi:hypothetical protein
MKTIILAAVVTLGLTASLVPAAHAGNATASDDAAATRMQQTGSYSR